MPINLDQFLSLDDNGNFTLDDGNDFNKIAKDLQGNILKSHGRNHAAHIFIEFTDKHAARAFISQKVAPKITSAKKQENDSIDFKTIKDNGTRKSNGTRMFISFSLSNAGYVFIEESARKPNEIQFVNGMKSSIGKLNDPNTSDWEKEYRKNWHALLIVANTRKSRVTNEITKWKHLLKNKARTHIELGKTIRNNDGQHIEHFGYVDGISQPLLVTKLSENISIKNWDPRAKLSSTLVVDKGGKPEISFGSFLVFRKLEQDVKSFKQAEIALAKELGVHKEYAGAQIVGRFRNGHPLISEILPQNQSPAKINDFNYDSDLTTGTKCPFHAHIRKMNPRGSGKNEPKEKEKTHLFVRRGIPFGENHRNTNQDDPSEGVGLLFMAYNQDINNQFEFMQADWANNPNFPNQPTPPIEHGLDGIIGQGAIKTKQNYLKGWEKNAEIKPVEGIGGFVKLQGGEYFFTPSISFLKSLSDNIT